MIEAGRLMTSTNEKAPRVLFPWISERLPTFCDPPVAQPGLRVLVCGGRDYQDRQFLVSVLDKLRADCVISHIIAGGARGADTFAEEWAKAVGLPCTVYRAEWERLGRKAGPTRNQQMLDLGMPNLVVAFPGGRGTADMVRRARTAGVEVIEITR